jgi:DNA-binding winged helix-turn-helix (wHTH) protein/Tfp pilus assembly protein PilF
MLHEKMPTRPEFDWQLDPASHELTVRGQRIRLADKPFRVLQALLESPGRVVTRETLRHLLWPDDTYVEFDNNLNSAVATLRHALGDSARSPRYIETLPRIGYRLRPAASAARPAPRARLTWTFGAAAGLLAGSVAALVLWTIALRPERGDAGPSLAASRNREAQTLCERGRYLRGQYEAGRQPAGALEQACDLLRAAARLDPAFGPAVAEEADTLVTMGFGGTRPFGRALTEARTAARRALQIDPRSGTAHRVIGMADLFLDWDFGAARAHLDQALELAPNDARTSSARATYLTAVGRHGEAILSAERAVALDPESYFVRADLAFFYLAAGRYAEAAESSRQVLAVAPDFGPALDSALLAGERLGRWMEAAASARALMSAAGASAAEIEKVAQLAPRDAVAAWRRWDLLETRRRSQGKANDFALVLALKHAAAGDRETALEYVRQALSRPDPLLALIRSFPEFEPLRGDPRFERLASTIAPQGG